MSGDIFELDQGDRETLRGTLHDPAATTGDVLTVQADKSIAAAPGGGGGGGSVVVRGPFPFDFTEAVALAAGVNVYTPAVDDILLDAWIEIDTLFDGTTPQADIGTFDGTNAGLFNVGAGAINISADADSEDGGVGILLGHGSTKSLSNMAGNGGFRIVPARFTAPNNLLLVVSQEGTIGGTPIDSAAGAGNLYIVTSTPVAF